MVTRFFAKRMSPGQIILLFHAQMEPLQDLITHLGCPFDEQRDSACRHDSLPSSPACASPRDCQTNGNKVCHRPRTREFSVSSEQEFYFPHFQTILWRNESKLKMVLQAEKHRFAWGWVLEALTEWSIRRKLRFLREERKLVLWNPVRGCVCPWLVFLSKKLPLKTLHSSL